MKKLICVTGIVAMLAGLIGCSNDDEGNPTGPDLPKNTTVWDSSDSLWITTLEADGSSGSYSYYDFETRTAVSLTDDAAKTSNAWDIAFKKSYIKTNGGASGPGGAKAVDLTTAGIVGVDAFADVDATELAAVTAGQWKSDSYDFALDSLWNYNPVTHQLSSKKYVYVLSDADGKYVKFQLVDVLDGLQPPQQGKMVIKFFYQGTAGSTDLSGAAEVDTIDAANGFYYDFSSGQVVTPSSPGSSKDWDIQIKAYDVYMNGSIFGPGSGAAFPIYDGLTDRTDFDAVTSVNQFGPPRWVADEMQSAFTATDWYNYDFNTHILTSKMNTYIVQTGGKSYKVEIISYYDPDTQASGTYTINWVEIQ